MLARLIAFALFLGGLSLAGVAAFIFLHDDPEEFPQAATVVVLSGPGAGVPGLEGEALDRVARGLDVFRAASADRIVMTGDGTNGGGRTHAEHMAEYAIAQGIAAPDVVLEPAAGSTLQNAWFTAALDGVDPAAPVIVVTHRYHLPRAWASFRWAGFTDITLAAPDSGGIEITSTLLMEAVKWPVNLVRGAGASLALALGAKEDQVLPWLG